MDCDASHGVQASKVALGDSIRSLVASFLSYLELRLKLLGLETPETGLNLKLNETTFRAWDEY
jgi:hypothetical protein